MRNLQKTLKLFDNNDVMDYCPLFDELKSVLEYCDKTVQPFSKLHFYSGNSAYIEECGLMLQQILIKLDLIHSETFHPLPAANAELRKLLVFLLFNTDSTYKYDLREDNSIAHVINVCPIIPKFMVLAIVWQLELDEHFYEMLIYTPIWFSFQHLGEAVESLKYLEDPYDVLQKVERLVRALLLGLARSELRHIDLIDQKTIYTKLEGNAMSLLRQFYTLDAEKFRNFKQNQFNKFLGFAMRHLLQMLLYAFDLYEQPALANAPNIDESMDIYEVCLAQNAKVQEWQGPSATLKETQKKIIMALLNSLQNNVMLVTLKVFIYWVEIDLDDGRNLQQIIGELAYRVLERIAANDEFHHDVRTQLDNISLRPKTMQETMRESNNGEILRQLNRELPTDMQRLWLDELFNRMDAFGNSECVETMMGNAYLMSQRNCEQVLQFIKLNERMMTETIEAENDEIDNEIFEPLRELLLAALQHFSTKSMLQMLAYKLELFGDPSSGSISFTVGDDFEHRLTKFFNKLMRVFDMGQFLRLCFENATLVWNKFFELACRNEKHIKHFCQTVRETQPYSTSHVQRALNVAMTDEQIQTKYFPELLCEIYFTLYHPARKMEFLKSLINVHVNTALEAQAYESLLPIVKTMNRISVHGETQSYKPLHFEEMTAPVLVMVARIMDKSRWDLVTYTNVRDELVRESIQFIQSNIKKFLPVATAKDRMWISKVAKVSFRPLTQYYFQRFALAPSQPPLHFDKFLFQKETTEHAEAEMFLIFHFVRCTMKETEWLAQSAWLLPHISNVLLMLAGVIKMTNTENSIDSFRHSLCNYANIVTKFLLPKALNDDGKLERLLMKILRIIAATPPSIYDEAFINFECILSEISKQFTKPLAEDVVQALQKYLATMPSCSGKEVFLNKFNEMAEIDTQL